MFSTDSIIPRIAMQNKCSFLAQFISHLQRKENSCYIMLKTNIPVRIFSFRIITCPVYHSKEKSTDVRFTFVLFLSLQFNFSKLFSLRQRECNTQLFKITLLRSETSLSPQIPLLYSHWHMYIQAK